MDDQGRDIVVIGTSAGGVEALRSIARGLPPDLGAAVFVVLHLWPKSQSLLPQILNGAGRLPAAQAVDGEALVYGRIYIAPPDRHLLLNRSEVRVVRGPRENRHRPSIDVLFRSAALAYGPRVTAVLLTGADDDGTAGARAVREAGGLVLVQDPHESAFPTMPQSALQNVKDVRCLKLEEIPEAIVRLAQQPVAAGAASGNGHPPLAQEVRLQETAEREKAGSEEMGTPSAFGCPECAARCGNWTLRVATCGSGAASGMRTRRTPSSETRRMPRTGRFGARCARWRKAPPCHGGWRRPAKPFRSITGAGARARGERRDHPQIVKHGVKSVFTFIGAEKPDPGGTRANIRCDSAAGGIKMGLSRLNMRRFRLAWLRNCLGGIGS
jgi:two-component system chemotaxis response regulator CheB